MDRTRIIQLRPIPDLVDSDILAMGNTIDLSFRDLFVEGTGQTGPIQAEPSICSEDSHWLLSVASTRVFYRRFLLHGLVWSQQFRARDDGSRFD